ncbi:MAG: DNA methyltransferase [Gammaproteobacteria bacterium]|nr:DNA methyltransferase [Gammaproteobacteria bacterium]MCY4226637.1 DNA methyltransferase [Gammaproteobacteria bacterium]
MTECNIKNRTLFHGDNLDFLRAINSETIDLIATDPPFNKGRDFHATPDSLASGAKFQDRWSWEKDVHEEWTDQLQDDHPAVWAVIDWSRLTYGDDMGAFLCFMAVRLLEMSRVLKSTGSIYLHCDPTASHYLKTLMDAVFGKKNFRNEIIWHYRRWTGKAKKFQQLHDTLFFYSKSKDYTFNVIHTSYTEGSKSRKKQGVLHRFKKGCDPVLVSDKEVDEKGVSENDVWQIPFIAPSAKERVGYPTQKPIALYSRIIKASSNEGDIVLDPFCGCATTLVSAELLDRQWVGIDIWDNAEKVILERMDKEGLSVSGELKTKTYGQTIHFTNKLPQRTDEMEYAVPFLRVKERVKEPDGPKWSRKDMYDHLIKQNGCRCMGCDRLFDDPRYLELDHNTPRSDNGINHISNRVLLCGPCNKLKSNTLTLSGLRQQNKKLGYMR